MIEFGKYIMKRYNIKIIKGGISNNEGFYYIFQLSPQQQYIMCNLKKYQLDEFVFKAKGMITEKTMTPYALVNGEYKYFQEKLILSGSKEFIELMLYFLFENIKQ